MTPPTLLPTQRGWFASLHDRQITGFYDTIRDAQMAASSLYGEGLYSIQQVTDAAGDLGFFSHAVHWGSP